MSVRELKRRPNASKSHRKRRQQRVRKTQNIFSPRSPSSAALAVKELLQAEETLAAVEAETNVLHLFRQHVLKDRRRAFEQSQRRYNERHSREQEEALRRAAELKVCLLAPLRSTPCLKALVGTGGKAASCR